MAAPRFDYGKCVFSFSEAGKKSEQFRMFPICIEQLRASFFMLLAIFKYSSSFLVKA